MGAHLIFKWEILLEEIRKMERTYLAIQTNWHTALLTLGLNSCVVNNGKIWQPTDGL